MKESPGNSIDREPEVDPSQDYQLLLGYENNTHTVLRFRRRLDTCDHHDIPITVSGGRSIFHCPTEYQIELCHLFALFNDVDATRKGWSWALLFSLAPSNCNNDPTLFTLQCVIVLSFANREKCRKNILVEKIVPFYVLSVK